MTHNMVYLFLFWIFYIGTVTSSYEMEHESKLPQELYNILHDMNLNIDHLQGRNLELTKTVGDLKLQNNYLTSQLNQMDSYYTQITTDMNIIKTQNSDFNIDLNIVKTKIKDFCEEKKNSEVTTDRKVKELNTSNNSEKIDKRILVSDPQFIQSIEVKLQDLTGKVDNIVAKHNVDVHKYQAELHSMDQNLRLEISNVYHRTLQGNIYTRWGRTTCPDVNGTEIVYSGYSAGTKDDIEGGAANYLCLPTNPTFYSQNLGYSHIYGVEYQENFAGLSIYNHDAPCAVCMAERTAIMMIPARDTCDQGWTTEYAGFLVSNRDSNKGKSEFVCLDAMPESIPGGNANLNGGLFYYVDSRCGSLPCTPYKEDGTLTCVVCSK